MPELPEVESLRIYLHDRLIGKRLESVQLLAFSALKTFDPALDSLVGMEVTNTLRFGKYFGLEFSAESGSVYLMMHLARGGWLRWQEEVKPTKAKPGSKGPMALRTTFSGGCGFYVTEAGTEKRLAIHVVRDPRDVENIATLGPDPLEISTDELASLLKSGSGQIKKVLADQRVVAGVGNAYSDEALHIAKLSPFRTANKLTNDEAARLALAVISVLSDAVARSKDLPAGELKSEKKSGMRVHGRTGEKCPECGDIVREVSFATKSLQYCATCQTDGKPLADRRMSRLLK